MQNKTVKDDQIFNEFINSCPQVKQNPISNSIEHDKNQDNQFEAEIRNEKDYKFYEYLEQGRYSKSFEEIEQIKKVGCCKVFKVKHRLD